MTMVNPNAMPSGMPPPPPPNHRQPSYHGNGVRNVGGTTVDQASSSMAGMNLNGSGRGRPSMPMPPPPSPMPPPPLGGRPGVPSTPGRAVPSTLGGSVPRFPQHSPAAQHLGSTPMRQPLPPTPSAPRSMPMPPPPPGPLPGRPSAVPSTPGRAVPRFTQNPPSSISSAPMHRPPVPHPPTPTAPRSLPGGPVVASTPSRGPMVPPSNNSNYGSGPPPSPLHHQYQQQAPQYTQQSTIQPPPPSPYPGQPQPHSSVPYNQPMQMQQGQQQNHVPPPPSPYHQTQQPPMPPTPSQPHPPSYPPNNTMQQHSMQQTHHVSRPPPLPSSVPPPPIPMSQQPGYPPQQPPPPPGLPQQLQSTQHQQQSYPQQQQQQQNQHPQGYPRHPQGYPPQQHHNQQPLQEKDKIDPSQIPRIPLFTRPHHAPATIYPSFSTPNTTSHTITTASTLQAMANRASLAGFPPPSDSRYVTSSEYENVNPRIMRSTVHMFPADSATSRKCDLPLGLVVTPLAGLSNMCGTGGKDYSRGAGGQSNEVGNANAQAGTAGGMSSQWNGREQGDIYGESNTTRSDDLFTERDYIPSAPNNGIDNDPERIPVLRGPKKPLSKGSKSFTRAVKPPRCDRCFSYLNPFCTPVSQSSFMRGAYSPVQYYNCNMCGTNGSIALSEEYISEGTFDAATRCGTVEYEVGGAYCVRKEGPVQNVHLYGVEYIPPDNDMGVDDKHNHHHHHHHGSVKSHGWQESLDAIREVARGLAATAPPKEEENGRFVSEVNLGLFAFCQDILVFPYLKRPKTKSSRDATAVDGGGFEQEDVNEAELAVAIVSDVTEDPFCPLPLHMWTHNLGEGPNSNEWRRFERILDSFSEVMEQLLGESTNSSSGRDPQQQTNEKWSLNCGGASLAALADALTDSGGRGTLITTRRPNFGAGALRDRETHPIIDKENFGPPQQQQQQGQQSAYRQPWDEQRLFTPLQHLVKLPLNVNAKDAQSKDGRAGLFYRQLGEKCASQRISLDIVVTCSAVTIPLASSPRSASNLGLKSIHPNPREFLDVATLAELCRASCGRFKWLRVGNECGVTLDDGNRGCTFTGEQLREELKRSALSYMGSDAVFKLRCSSGVQVKSYCPTLPTGTIIGDGIVDSAELELSNIHSGSSIAVLLEHKVGGTKDPMVFFQSAVLYTTLTGRRRVRVSTMGLVTTKVPADVFRSADLGTVAAVLTRQAISDVEHPDEGSLHNARTKVFQQCVSVLANYRKHTTARTSPAGQLILPESLQLLPLFCLSLRKSRLFKNSNIPFKAPFPTADERAYHIFYGRMVSPHMSLQCVHPNLLQLSDMRTRDGEWIAPPALETSKYVGEKMIAASMQPVCQLPKSMNPSISCLDDNGMYILDDRYAFYLFVGKDVPEEDWRQLLSITAEPGASRVGGEWVNNVPMGELSLAASEAGHKLQNILLQLRALNSPNSTLAMNARHTYAPLILVFVGRGSVFEEEMDSLLVDDPDGHEKSYVDFLCDVHRAVRQKCSED